MKSTAWLDGWWAHRLQKTHNPYREDLQAVSAYEWEEGWGAREMYISGCAANIPNYDVILEPMHLKEMKS